MVLTHGKRSEKMVAYLFLTVILRHLSNVGENQAQKATKAVPWVMRVRAARTNIGVG